LLETVRHDPFYRKLYAQVLQSFTSNNTFLLPTIHDYNMVH